MILQIGTKNRSAAADIRIYSLLQARDPDRPNRMPSKQCDDITDIVLKGAFILPHCPVGRAELRRVAEMMHKVEHVASDGWTYTHNHRYIEISYKCLARSEYQETVDRIIDDTNAEQMHLPQYDRQLGCLHWPDMPTAKDILITLAKLPGVDRMSVVVQNEMLCRDYGCATELDHYLISTDPITQYIISGYWLEYTPEGVNLLF